MYFATFAAIARHALSDHRKSPKAMTKSRPFFCRRRCLFTLALAALAIWAMWDLFRTYYTHVDLLHLRSPTGAWTAVVADDTMEGPIAGLGDDTRTVYLTSKQHPKEADATELLEFDADYYDNDWPRIAWSAPNVLRVTVPNLSFPSIDTLHLDGVTVDLHYDPDDPAARAKWQKYHDDIEKHIDDGLK